MCVGGAGVYQDARGNVYDGEFKDKKNGQGEVRGGGGTGAQTSTARECDGKVAGETGVEMRDRARGGAGWLRRSRRRGRSESERRIRVGRSRASGRRFGRRR